MPIEENKAIVRLVFEEGFNRGNLEPADQHVAEDCADHSIFPIPFTGREAIKKRFQVQRATFADLHFTFEDVVAEGDRVVWRWTMRGTDTGGFMGRPPTGKAVEVAGVNIQRLEEGMIVEHWSFPDLVGMLRQLGVMPGGDQRE